MTEESGSSVRSPYRTMLEASGTETRRYNVALELALHLRQKEFPRYRVSWRRICPVIVVAELALHEFVPVKSSKLDHYSIALVVTPFMGRIL